MHDEASLTFAQAYPSNKEKVVVDVGDHSGAGNGGHSESQGKSGLKEGHIRVAYSSSLSLGSQYPGLVSHASISRINAWWREFGGNGVAQESKPAIRTATDSFIQP